MSLPSTYPLAPGQYFLWNAEYRDAGAPGLQHTATRVLVTGLDRRRCGAEPQVCYAVAGDEVQLTHCTQSHFLASCRPDPGPCWLPAEAVQAAMAGTAQAIAASEVPGDYAFSPERRAGLSPISF
jgi:hypothetical protein